MIWNLSIVFLQFYVLHSNFFVLENQIMKFHKTNPAIWFSIDKLFFRCYYIGQEQRRSWRTRYTCLLWTSFFIPRIQWSIRGNTYITLYFTMCFNGEAYRKGLWIRWIISEQMLHMSDRDFMIRVLNMTTAALVLLSISAERLHAGLLKILLL